MPPRWSNMRIIAVPLTTRAVASSQAATNAILPLTYYHFHMPPPPKGNQETMLDKAIGKASGLWAGFGKAPEGNWKRRVFVYGEKLIDRIDFEELSLKSLDPSLGPRIGQLRTDNPEKDTTLIQIPLYYPPSAYADDGGMRPLSHITLLLEKRHPLHKKGFYTWLVIIPLTAPFALIPIIPNLPFFYAAWRAWSHYKAWKSSQYMQGLIASKHVVEQPSSLLDDVYKNYASRHPELEESITSDSKSSSESVGSEKSPRPPPRHPHLLLSVDGVEKIVEIFNLAGSAKSDITRAVEQARARVEEVGKL